MDKEFLIRSNFRGDRRIEPHIVYQRDKITYCIYCGKEADTREHCPPRALLKKPFPCDLPVLPACRECNNGFSGDELYVKTYLRCIKEVLQNKNEEAVSIQTEDRREVIEAKQTVTEHIIHGFSFDDRIGRILKKLSIGHIVYELSEGYYGGLNSLVLRSIKYSFRTNMTKQEWDELNDPEIINTYLLPEIGSRVFRNIYIVHPILVSIDTDEQKKAMVVLLDWTDVQENMYRYLAFVKGNDFFVRIVMHDFLYAEVTFSYADLIDVDVTCQP